MKEMCDVVNRRMQTEHELAKEVGCSFARSRLGMAFMSCTTLKLVIQRCLKYSYSVTLIVELCLSISIVSDLEKKKKDISSLFRVEAIVISTP